MLNFSICHQGGLSEGYKNYIAEKELPDDTYTEDGLALFRVQGTGPDNMQAIQVEPVSAVSNYFIFLLYDVWLVVGSGHLKHIFVLSCKSVDVHCVLLSFIWLVSSTILKNYYYLVVFPLEDANMDS